MVNIFEKDVLLDITVNLIPLVIITIFTAMILVVEPWGGSLLGRIEQLLLLVLPFIGLAILTYWAAQKIEGAPGEVEPAGVGVGEE
ncbi:DUF6684 family protein [Halocalculus aciditolerans]|uniref:Cox cluster protein n=1 Tax=Halocalculus aciditolerans TaxID=1383812 RepID=A0A830FCD0_9EURY|nr:DUF6684 family protein [Halocalculus aciditolerans]GGL61424.1 hypothetical protein GCM10009039_19510 [Halocalculus aciditolerans]